MPRKILIQVRRDTAANWTSVDPILAAGEFGYETNTGKIKIGDGSTAWNSLSYLAPSSGSSPLTTKGDLWGFSTVDARIPVGTDGDVLTADSAQALGVRWAAPSGGGGGGSFAGVRVYRSTTQSIPNNAYTAISFDTEEFDTDGYHDLVTNPNRLTVPTGKGGYYLISAVLVFANNGTGQRLAVPRINGSDFLAVTSEPNPGGSWAAHMNVSTIFHLSDGDYIELMGYQSSGGNLNAITPGNPGHYCPMLGMARLG